MKVNKNVEAIPDVLVSLKGEKIETAEQWQQMRRPEILDLFREHVYGREPQHQPEALSFNVTRKEGFMNGTAVRKVVDIVFEGPGGKWVFPLVLFVPAQISKPLPVFLLLNNRGTQKADPDRKILHPRWPVEMILSRGYAAAVIQVEDIDPDEHDGFKNGIHGVIEPPDRPRPANAWGTISAWAWGASRAMDYFETDADLDAARVAVVGHSRCGKTALWAGAVDQRFSMVVSNNSGSTGAAISRGNTGETVENINSRFPHWFTENYRKYNGNESELPVDQHMLLALIAPRIVYVASASEDAWADPEGEFLATVLAEPAFRLFGLQGLESHQFPKPDEPIRGDKMGYHLRNGAHDLLEFDWKCYMDLADKYLI